MEPQGADCFSFLSLSGSEIVERLFNKIPQMSVPRNPLPKYVAKTALRLISIGRDWQPSARLPPHGFLRWLGLSPSPSPIVEIALFGDMPYTNTTLADLLTLLLAANPFSTMRASLRR